VPTCRDVSELVTDYLERSLSWPQWVGVRWHLAQCDACRRYLTQMRETIRLLATNVLPPPTAETETRVIDAVRGTRPEGAAGD